MNRELNAEEFERIMNARGIFRENYRQKLAPLTLSQYRTFHKEFGFFPHEAIAWFGSLAKKHAAPAKFTRPYIAMAREAAFTEDT